MVCNMEIELFVLKLDPQKTEAIKKYSKYDVQFSIFTALEIAFFLKGEMLPFINFLPISRVNFLVWLNKMLAIFQCLWI